MGKPYGHNYFFAGSGSSCGTMQCASCNKPIDNKTSDWMAYRRDKKGDWGFVCFHRNCRADQSSWEKIEKARADAENRHVRLLSEMRKYAEKNGITNAVDFAELAAEALGADDLYEGYS